MIESKWKYSFVSVTGTSHKKTGSACQDFSMCDILSSRTGGTILTAVASDGAGSAKYAEQGSKLACDMLMHAIRRCLEQQDIMDVLNRSFFEEWLQMFQDEVQRQANQVSGSVRDFACTLLAAVVTDTHGAFVQIGDGAIVVSVPGKPEEYNWIFWPDQGEYANTTCFATDRHASQHLRFERFEGCCEEVALFTDGLQMLALHYQTQTAHNPFFRSFFSHLRSQKERVSKRYCQSLYAFLDSFPVNQRTDDDKTLILATRRR
ncbi:protein phosphatase 2C domain-containing protein [Fodinisporobacter ferrooxydans]|uniref:Protein phosphatase 2C domain-containing protein n=1 Tax=Fodinisporobacter ferrooxydans TaxID=2901836 RepID=A0ABY4CT68_9BACL|nr:protein phosphatase 2C domain-containing protein [Alicyclobacillaceae bacterium MYW30-H2]